MPPGGVKELVKSAEGRKYLNRLQKKYEIDLIQPGDPRFLKVYGNKVKKFNDSREKRERLAKDEWAERKEKQEHEKTKKTGVGKIIL